MMWNKAIAYLALALLMHGLILPAAAQNNARISEMTPVDLQYMDQQRATLDDLAARNFGLRFTSDKHNDLQLLQRLLDERLVRPDQTRELQAMGVVMGDLLATELGMHWVIYEDRLGRSRALRYRETAEYLFPMTMISRRREADNQTPVTQIYQKAYDIIAPLTAPRPFQ